MKFKVRSAKTVQCSHTRRKFGGKSQDLHKSARVTRMSAFTRYYMSSRKISETEHLIFAATTDALTVLCVLFNYQLHTAVWTSRPVTNDYSHVTIVAFSSLQSPLNKRKNLQIIIKRPSCSSITLLARSSVCPSVPYGLVIRKQKKNVQNQNWYKRFPGHE